MSERKRFRLHEDDDISDARERKKKAEIERNKEHEHGGFSCSHCREWAPVNEHIGTHNRNHCPHCLWSKHMDKYKPGDRKSDCKSGMEPIAVALKEEGADRYAAFGKRLGEIMLVHQCTNDGAVRINRIAADDNPTAVMDVFNHGQNLPSETLSVLDSQLITLASTDMEDEVRAQLIGRGALNDPEF